MALIVMSFQRKFSYHLISVYIPSLSLFIISMVTMLVKIEHFDSTIMVHLTSMLVMYTLFQAISVSLPKVYSILIGACPYMSSYSDFLHQVDGYLAAVWAGSSLCWICSDICRRNIARHGRRQGNGKGSFICSIF